MNISEGLKIFLGNAPAKSKRDRYVGFLSNNKGHIKFSKSLSHDFTSCLDRSLFTTKFTDEVLNQPGDLYCANGVTNDSEASMMELYGKAPWEGGWLLTNKTGKIAIYRAEGKIDDEVYIAL